MTYLKLETFLNIFSNKKKQTFHEFLNSSRVRSGKNLRNLKEYVKEKNIDMSDIKLIFENIQNRNEYLTRFFNLSMMVHADKVDMNAMEPMKNKHMNNNEEILFKNPIRNMHYRDILKNTKSGIENVPTYMDVLTDLYVNNIIDYKILTPSSRFYIRNGRIGSVFSSYYFRASIMNPYLVYSLNKSVLHGSRIFTPTLGWTSYCYGFLECEEVTEYVGTDVIPSVCIKTAKFARARYPNKKVDIYCKPSEELAKSRAFLNKYRGYFDVVFFSPPYYKLETYKGGEQSTEKYKTYEEWLKGYWEETIKLCHYVLQKDGKLCYILSGYGSENTKEEYDLLKDMNIITKKYFKLKSTQPMYNKNVHVTEHKEPSEKIMIFTRGTFGNP
jgi:hypothetical protein|uniref:DNA methylase N-4/N-6 domain-containing protein n=1 Tax=viral metagenome TaxID=1070528 RepID=A0A6C0JNF5_9ZZZZ